MLRDKAITELLELACPSIKYRIKAEILGQSTSHKDLVELQSQILQDPTIKEVINWQQPDGWLGWDFHGARSIETGIRILCEKGVHRCHPALAKALEALERYSDRLGRGIGNSGSYSMRKGSAAC